MGWPAVSTPQAKPRVACATEPTAPRDKGLQLLSPFLAEEFGGWGWAPSSRPSPTRDGHQSSIFDAGRVQRASGSDRPVDPSARLSHPLMTPAEAPPYSPLLFRRTTGTAGHSRHRLSFITILWRVILGHCHSSPALGRLFWDLGSGPSHFCSALEPRRGDCIRPVDHESHQIAPFPCRPFTGAPSSPPATCPIPRPCLWAVPC
jgi:hypothetical protein